MQITPGDYLECGEEESFSRVLVLSENKVLVKDGTATGDVMSLDEWYFIVGEARSTIRHATYFDIPKVDTLCVDTLCVDAPVRLIRVPSIHAKTRLSDYHIRTQATIPVALPPTKRTWNEWFFSVFLCGLNDLSVRTAEEKYPT